MKKILLGLVLFGIVTISYADQQKVATQTSINEFKEQYCEAVLSMSKVIMKGKQSGIPIDRALSLIKDEKGSENIFTETNKLIVLDAYDQPNFSSEKYKNEQLNDFTAKQYISCMKAAGLF
ncbi:hypothetical protein [Acinetobacter junii]|uniref:hypothetical protein n=1 Tax=Acinetobacter junii TaxID=40215 RepID=UPI00125079CB|nr:hypothetical protein [Acinetobacter junii]